MVARKVQWRSQSAADARAQHGHKPRTQAPPSFSGLQYGNAEETRGVWGVLSQKILEFLSFLGRFWGYFRPYRRLELTMPLLRTCAQRKFTIVLTANTYTSRSGEHTDLVNLKIQIAKLRSSISTPLRTFSAQFAIDKGTFGTDNFQELLHWWGTTSSCCARAPVCPSLATPLERLQT